MLTIEQLEQNIWNVNLVQLTSTREIIYKLSLVFNFVSQAINHFSILYTSYRSFFISFHKLSLVFLQALNCSFSFPKRILLGWQSWHVQHGDHLTVKNYVDMITQKISKSLGILFKLSATSNNKKLYFYLINPFLLYGNCADIRKYSPIPQTTARNCWFYPGSAISSLFIYSRCKIQSFICC